MIEARAATLVSVGVARDVIPGMQETCCFM